MEVYQMAHRLAMEVFTLAISFPAVEKYSLTSQLTRASRSIALNIAEGWGRRTYSSELKRSLVYSMGSLEETRSGLQFAVSCGYISTEKFEKLIEDYKILAAKLYKLYSKC